MYYAIRRSIVESNPVRAYNLSMESQTFEGRSMRRRAAFTLVEMMVVIGIMLLLAGMLMPALRSMKEGRKSEECRAEIEYLKTAANQYRDEFGDYPPSDIGLAANDVPNQGNKALVACLATSQSKQPYLRSYLMTNHEKVRLTNVQAAAELDWRFKENPRNYREMLDPWGSPYIYLHNRDYGSTTGYLYTVQGRAAGGGFESPCTVTAQKDSTDAYYGAASFQIWSCGPNRTNDNGTEDDIVSWKQ